MAVTINKILVLAFCLPPVSFQNSDTNEGMFTSSTDLQGLVATEAELVSKLHAYMEEEANRLEKLRKVIKQYESLRDDALQGEERFVGNPLNSFLLIKRLTSDWKTVQNMLDGAAGEKLFANLTSQRDSLGLKWPSDEDLNGAAVGLMRLQDTYRYWAALIICNIYFFWSQTRHRQPGPRHPQWSHIRPRPFCP